VRAGTGLSRPRVQEPFRAQRGDLVTPVPVTGGACSPCERGGPLHVQARAFVVDIEMAEHGAAERVTAAAGLLQQRPSTRGVGDDPEAVCVQQARARATGDVAIAAADNAVMRVVGTAARPPDDEPPRWQRGLDRAGEREVYERLRDRRVQPPQPSRMRCGPRVRDAHIHGAEIHWAHDHGKVHRPDPLGERVQLLDGGIPDRQATVRDAVAVDHDVAAEPGAAVLAGPGTVECVGVIDPERQVIATIGVERRDAIHAFRYLVVPLLELRSDPAARRSHEVRADETPAVSAVGPHLQSRLVLQRDERGAAWRERDGALREAGREACPGGGERGSRGGGTGRPAGPHAGQDREHHDVDRPRRGRRRLRTTRSTERMRARGHGGRRAPCYRTGWRAVKSAARCLAAAVVLTGIVGAAHAAPLVVCTLGFHGPDEVAVFREHLLPPDFEFVDLSPRPPAGTTLPESWLLERCGADLRCDVVVYSAEFAGRFFGSSGASLGIQEMEEASCRARCDGIFHAPREVFLLACNTLATKDQDRRTQREYLQVLLDHDFDRATAERVVALRYGPLGPSFRESLRRIFMGVPRIYGFASVAPVGSQSAPFLERYFHLVGDYRRHLEHAGRGTAPNRALLDAFAGTSLVQTVGLTAGEPAAVDRERVCRLYDEGVSVAERLRLVRELMDRPDFLAFLPAVEVFVGRHPAEGLQGEEQALFEDLRRREMARTQVLALIRALDVSALQLELAHLALHLGWMSPVEVRTLAVAGARRLVARPLTTEVTDVVCEITRHEPLRDVFTADALPPALFERAEGIRLIDCLSPADPGVTLRLLPALDASDLATRLWGAYALSHRLPLPDTVLTALAAHLDDPSPELRERLSWIFRAQRPGAAAVQAAIRARDARLADELTRRR